MAQATGIQELQKAALIKMLQLGDAVQWKVLIYDKFCQEVVAPLMKVGSLRQQGVTTNHALSSDRSSLPDVPAIYFVEPTTENIQRIQDDLSKGLYESYYINFASSVPRSLLEELAKGTLRANAAQKVHSIVDRYVSFVSLSSTLFSLNLPCVYRTLHSPSITEREINQYVERIVDGLMSVLVTMRVLPIIRCPPNEVAEVVARRLEQRIRELLQTKDAAELFSGAARGSIDAAASQRPLLCIFDRDVDLAAMLHHTWTYQSMAHDILGMRLNKLTVPVDSPDGNGPPKPKSYDVDESDSFWVTHAGEAFPTVAEAVHQAIEDFNKKRSEMSRSGEGEDPTAALAPGLATAINALPEMTEKKRSIDMHTNIATALLNEIKARGLDRYYEMEAQFASQSSSTSIQQLEKLIDDPKVGTTLDKTRALMVLYLSKPTLQPEKLKELQDRLCEKNRDADVSGLAYLQHLASIRNMTLPQVQPVSSSAGASSGFSLDQAASSIFSGVDNIMSQGLSKIKTLTAKKEALICQVFDGLMEQKVTPVVENYLYLDPKVPPGTEVPRMRAPFRRGIAFVVGGGNYTELQLLQEWAQSHGRHITYGSTDMVSPCQ
eukprot:CAMPEP_0178378808 /NCGR_PEP_ID=MMETSP0689_2-20121128/4616_1 /TAXON_ID=160604 /ORGANISM="Amphidinium massartii, Strain CS-259" /LENGTH=604 /DNA_ID=CAMNT_0019998887 /DNA_START=11 /DNA_END=1822 /DNA_ORIENTATION=-